LAPHGVYLPAASGLEFTIQDQFGNERKPWENPIRIKIKEDQNHLVHPITDIFKIKLLKPPKPIFPSSLRQDLTRYFRGQMCLQEFLSRRTSHEGHQFVVRLALEREVLLTPSGGTWGLAWQRGELVCCPTDPQWQPQFLQSSPVSVWNIPVSVEDPIYQREYLEQEAPPLTHKTFEEAAEKISNWEYKPQPMYVSHAVWDQMVEDHHQKCSPLGTQDGASTEEVSVEEPPTLLSTPYECVQTPEPELLSMWHEKLLNTVIGSFKLPNELLNGNANWSRPVTEQSLVKKISSEVNTYRKAYERMMKKVIDNLVAEEIRRKAEEKRIKLERKQRRQAKAGWRF
jgi:hypothetical protein